MLAASDGLALTDRPEDADVILFNTCSVREKAQERVFHDLGRVRALKAERPDLIIGVGGCVASQEGAAIVGRAPYVDVVFGPQTLHRLPAMIRARRATRPAADRHLLSRDREIRPSAAGARRRTDGVRVDHGRLQQVLHVLRGPVYARRGGLASVRRRADRDRRSRRPGRRRNHAARAERQRVPRLDGRFGGGRRPRDADRVHRGSPRHRAHPLHDVASEGDDAPADRDLRARGEARVAPPPARAVGIGSHPGSDEARLHRARVQVDRACGARRAARPVGHLRLHRRLPRRVGCRFRADDASRRGSELRWGFQFCVQPAPGNAGRRPGGPGAAGNEAGAPRGVANGARRPIS